MGYGSWCSRILEGVSISVHVWEGATQFIRIFACSVVSINNSGLGSKSGSLVFGIRSPKNLGRKPYKMDLNKEQMLPDG